MERVCRLGADIGGTFTDVALETPAGYVTTKVLTTPAAPEIGVLNGIRTVLAEAGIGAGDVGLFIHGTTLATNALIERKGARTAVIGTEGHRDTLDLGYEDRFSEYDVFVQKPPPLVPRHLRFTVPERCSAEGRVLLPLDEAAVSALVQPLRAHRIESVAVSLIHGYANPTHERRIRDILAAALPDLRISLSSEVAPEIREYDRLSTTVCNAFVQPLMAGYLERMSNLLGAEGLACPLLMMLSGGGLATLDTARRFPIRLVESGPAAGAIMAGQIAAECGLDAVVSFDMGGTTAKICLLDGGRPTLSRSFEVDRVYRFQKGSGLPVRIPVVEMVEIGAGGGSIGSVDALGRLRVGPDSAGADPGPACYGRGGTRPTVTDADLVLGRIDPALFAGGSVGLDEEASGAALARSIGEPLGLDPVTAAFGLSEVVDENMANAARVHGIERGKMLSGRTLIAFGGAAPLHAARVAEKLGMTRIVVPTNAGVGSAIGFLGAPFAYEVVRSRHMRLGRFDPETANRLLADMAAEAESIVAEGAAGQELVRTRSVEMRYHGQGHEITVTLPDRDLVPEDADLLREAFGRAYGEQYGRAVAGVEIEVMTFTLAVATPRPPPRAYPDPVPADAPAATGSRPVFAPALGQLGDSAVYLRDDLAPGMRVAGPAVIGEAQTTTVVPAGFVASIHAAGHIILDAIAADPS